MRRKKAVIFDWGNTIMRDDHVYQGAMSHWPRVELMPGVQPTMRGLPPDLIRCLASNAEHSDSYLVWKVLNRMNALDYFHRIFTSRDMGVQKPDPAFFRKILRGLRARAGDCVVVGDSYRNDIVPAKSIGMRTIWFCRQDRCGDAPSADIIIRSMYEAAEAVRKLTDTG